VTDRSVPDTRDASLNARALPVLTTALRTIVLDLEAPDGRPA